MIDYEIKAKCLKDTEYLDYKNAMKTLYNCEYHRERYNDKEYDIVFNNALDILEHIGQKKREEFYRLDRARISRVRLIKKRLSYMLSLGNVIFLTFTFGDDCFATTNEKTRRKYVINYLNKFSDYYIANQDFGKQKGREHYHACILADNVDYSLWKWRIDGIRIGFSNGNHLDEHIKKVSKYIAKLTNHAIKSTNKRSVVIYSRSFPKDL